MSYGAPFFYYLDCLLLLTNVCSLSIVRRQNDVCGEISRLIYRRIAIVDLIGGLSGCVFYAIFVVRNTWPFNIWSCRALLAIMFGAMLQSMAYLTCINVDRYIAISRPLRYHSILTPRFVRIGLGLTVIPVLAFITSSLVPNSPLYNLFRVGCGMSRNETLDIDKTDKMVLYATQFLLMAPIFVGMTLNFVSMMISVRQARAVSVAALDATLSSDQVRKPS